MNFARRCGGLGLALLLTALSGCGTPGAPEPPSLNLPEKISDLAASRAGDQVVLTWVTPRRNTDKIVLKTSVAAHICRREGDGSCAAVADVTVTPGAPGSYTDTLTGSLRQGAPRPLTYLIELNNRRGRSAGLSNPAVVLAGQAPGAVTELFAQVRKAGIVLHWGSTSPGTKIRLHRKLLTAQPAKKDAGPLAAPAPPEEQNLIVNSAGGRALDKDIVFGNAYEYRAQQIAQIDIDGRTVELPGPVSDPIRVEALDVFPPEPPTGLAAVATAPADGTPAAVDLNWEPNLEANLAGYIVYRRQTAGDAWQRVSPAQPVTAPAFHDARVQPGQSYQYAVSAVDQAGHESGRSTPAAETVPTE